MLLSTEATARRATITATERSTDSSAFFRVMPPGLLQLVDGRTAVMSHTAFTVSLFGGVFKLCGVVPILI